MANQRLQPADLRQIHCGKSAGGTVRCAAEGVAVDARPVYQTMFRTPDVRLATRT